MTTPAKAICRTCGRGLKLVEFRLGQYTYLHKQSKGWGETCKAVPLFACDNCGMFDCVCDRVSRHGEKP